MLPYFKWFDFKTRIHKRIYTYIRLSVLVIHHTEPLEDAVWWMLLYMKPDFDTVDGFNQSY